jgi:hypothetical protein
LAGAAVPLITGEGEMWHNRVILVILKIGKGLAVYGIVLA